MTHFDARRVFDVSGGGWNLSWLLFAALGHGTVQTIYSYLGYYNVCNLGGEMKNPEKNIPRAIFISIIGITALYLAMQTSILSVIPWREAAQSSFIVSTFIERAYGSQWATLATALILVTALGSVFAAMLGYSRVPYAAALDGNFLLDFRARTSDEAFPLHFAAGAGRGGSGIQPAVEPFLRHSRHPGDALHHPIYRPGGGVDPAAATLGERAIAVPHVAVSAAGGRSDHRLGRNFHFHGTQADARVARRGDGRNSCIFGTRAMDAPVAL